MIPFKKLITLFLLSIFLLDFKTSLNACEVDHSSPSIKIEETTVGNIANCSVGVGNIFSEDYQDEKGITTRGRRASLNIFECPLPYRKDRTVRVHEGEKIKIGKSKFIVEKIYENTKGDQRGYIELRSLMQNPKPLQR